jgi:hypothetical protein
MKIMPYARNTMVNQFADLLQTPYIETEAVISGDAWIVEYKQRELQKLTNLRQSIYFNHQAMQLFKGRFFLLFDRIRCSL